MTADSNIYNDPRNYQNMRFPDKVVEGPSKASEFVDNLVAPFTNIFSSFTHQITGEDSLSLGNQYDWADVKKIQVGGLADYALSAYSEIEFLQIAIPRITYRDSEVVEDYLAERQEISDFLIDVWPTVSKYFDKSIGVELEVMSYPDDSGEDELVGWIQYVEGDVEDGLDKLENLEEAILDEQLERVDCTFNFNIEFK